MLASLETRLRAVSLSPYRAGLAGRGHKRLLTPPAFAACSGPVWLSPPGQPVTQRSSFRTSPVCDGDLAPGDAAHGERIAHMERVGMGSDEPSGQHGDARR